MTNRYTALVAALGLKGAAVALIVASASGCGLVARDAGRSQAAPRAALADVAVLDVAVLDVESSWDNIGVLFLGAGSGVPYGTDSMYAVRGKVENRKTHAVHHVVLRYELLDEDGHVVDFQEGYNRRAEHFGDGSGRDGDIEPLAPGDSDDFRMVFFGDEVPRFTTHRVAVVEAVVRD